jgi:DNA polymerase III delta prime subunit
VRTRPLMVTFTTATRESFRCDASHSVETTIESVCAAVAVRSVRPCDEAGIETAEMASSGAGARLRTNRVIDCQG